MIALCRDEDYRRALLAADLAIADSGFMVLLWKCFTGERVPRISGLEHVKRLLEHESVWQPGAVLWVVPTESSREKLEQFLARTGEDRGRRTAAGGTTAACHDRRRVSSEDLKRGRDSARPSSQAGSSVAPSQHLSISASQHLDNVYIAPRYSRPVEDEALLTLVRQTRPETHRHRRRWRHSGQARTLPARAPRLPAGDPLHRRGARLSHRRPGPHP